MQIRKLDRYLHLAFKTTLYPILCIFLYEIFTCLSISYLEICEHGLDFVVFGLVGVEDGELVARFHRSLGLINRESGQEVPTFLLSMKIANSSK